MARLTVNQAGHEVSLERERSLLFVLREELGLTGAKMACGEGECGACTVLLEGRPVHGCVTPIRDVAVRAVTTIEGLAQGGELAPVQRAFVELGALQCGFCTPGMILAATALLAEHARPSEAEIRAALNGNLCRCGMYARIVAAVRRAAELMAGAR
jgi:aerobic-type carbon monoxide dehydrogenase small subunit (CoxS/CutS family)